MQKILIIIASLITTAYIHAQILHDNGPIIDPQYAHLRFALNGGKWNKTNLTYYISNTSNSLTATQRLSIIQTAFQRWAVVSMLSFAEVSIPSSADIRLKWDVGDHGDGDPFSTTILAHAFAPPPMAPTAYAGEVHFNDAHTWKQEGSSGSGYILLNTAIHEIGHALGVAHSNVSGTIMWPEYNGLIQQAIVLFIKQFYISLIILYCSNK
jgi:predicted Zn-dependent protease